MVRLVIPVLSDAGLDSRLSDHFGRAPYFAVVELNENGEVKSFKVVSNRSEHFGGFGRPPDIILGLSPNAVVTYGMGPRALNIFQNAGVAVLQTSASTVKEAVEAYRQNELRELTEGCREAKHPF